MANIKFGDVLDPPLHSVWSLTEKAHILTRALKFDIEIDEKDKHGKMKSPMVLRDELIVRLYSREWPNVIDWLRNHQLKPDIKPKKATRKSPEGTNEEDSHEGNPNKDEMEEHNTARDESSKRKSREEEGN